VQAQAAQIEAQAGQIATLSESVAEMDADLGQPPKTPRNSLVPQTKGDKANQPNKPRAGRPGTFRALPEKPDRTFGAAALSQGRIILRPVRDPVPRLGIMKTTLGVVLERHGRPLPVVNGASAYADEALAGNRSRSVQYCPPGSAACPETMLDARPWAAGRHQAATPCSICGLRHAERGTGQN